MANQTDKPPARSLETLEEEHRLLSERRRRLHETIDLLEGLDRVKPDAAARLEQYKLAEGSISAQRRSLYRTICELRLAERRYQQ